MTTMTPPRSSNTGLKLFLAVGGLAMLSTLWPSPEPAPRARPAPAAVQPAPEEHYTTAAGQLVTRAAVSQLRAGMRNPASFQLVSATGTADGQRVCIVYRGQNGFGGMNVEAASVQGGKLRAGPGVRCKRGPVNFTGLF